MERIELLDIMDKMAEAVIKLERWNGQLLHLAAASGKHPSVEMEDIIASYALLRASLGLAKGVYRNFGVLRVSLEVKQRDALFSDLGVGAEPVLVREKEKPSWSVEGAESLP